MPSRWFKHALGIVQIALILWIANPDAAHGLSVTGYTSAANDRFSSGYVSTPVSTLVSNTDSSFVGLGYDWSGVGWNYSNIIQSFGMISPRHYLVAAHWGGASLIQFYGADGTLYLATQQSVVNTGCGPATSDTSGNVATPDVSLGTLTAPVPASAQVAYYPLLDLVSSTSTANYSNYVNKSYFMYGFTGKVAINTTTSIGYSNTGYNIASSATGSATAGFQVGDSGSPAFIAWTDPNSNKHLTMLGHNWAMSTITNYHALTPANDVATKLNTMMAAQGYALRWVADAATTWNGNTSALLNVRNNWSPRQVPSDAYLAFSGNSATNRTLSLGADQTQRGITFLSATAGKSFTFQSGNTLTLGRGGIINYDANNTQSFACNITLSDAQWWESGTGGLIVSGTINNSGHQLVVDGPGSTQLSSLISGTGGLAKEGTGILTLSGSSSFSGPLFVHNGTLNLTGTAAGTGAATIESTGTLQGTGQLATSSSNSIAINGVLSPGDATTSGTLTVVPTSGTLALGSTATLVFNAGTSSDLVALSSGTVTLGGTLQIGQNTGFSYANTYTIFSGLGATPTGSFSAVTGLAAGFTPAFNTTNGNYTVSFLPTTYAAWQQAHFTAAEIASGLADDTADPDNDGIQNLTEYALGLDPRASSSIAASVVTTSGTYLTLTVTKNPNATDLTYTVEVTSDLTDASSWTSTGITVTETATTLVAQDQTAVADAPRRFMRLRVTR
jgi:autotransporter-associated beta strand protein